MGACEKNIQEQSRVSAKKKFKGAAEYSKCEKKIQVHSRVSAKKKISRAQQSKSEKKNFKRTAG